MATSRSRRRNASICTSSPTFNQSATTGSGGFGHPQQARGVAAEIDEQGAGVGVRGPAARRQGRNDRCSRPSLDRPARYVHRPLPLPGRAARRARRVVCGGSRNARRRMCRGKGSGPAAAGLENQRVRPRGPSWPPRPREPPPTRRGRTSSLHGSIRPAHPVASPRARKSRKWTGIAEVDGNRTRRTGITRPARFEGGGSPPGARTTSTGDPSGTEALPRREARLRRPAGLGRRCRRRGGAASTSPAPLSGVSAHG